MIDGITHSKEFLSELARYYMAFLESDFSGRSAPSRKIGAEPESEVHLTDYPGVNEMALKALLSHFNINPFGAINRDSAVIRIPESICKQAVNQIDDENIDFASIETYINRELRKRKLPGKFKIEQLLEEVVEPTLSDVTNYLNEYRLAGLYDELYDLWKNKLLTDKHEFYLYFFDICYEEHRYPVFYIPLSVEQNEHGSFSVEFDSVLLINKKAIEYVTGLYAEEQKKDWQVELPPRHIYLANFQSETEFITYLKSIISELTDFLGMRTIDLKRSQDSELKTKNGKYEITNQCYFVLADKSDESLLNDYEELLTLLQSGENSEALALFNKLSEDFLVRNPKSFARVIEEDYENKTCSERLGYTSPIPLNKEQIQVLKSIDTEGCDRIIIEGPPGTGKSHTITAIIFNALMGGKSVLMVSDKKEALDVVEDKINSVLDKMKLEDFVQNPILRLGKKDSNFAGIFKAVNYEKIKTRHGAYRRHKEQVESEIKGTHSKMKYDIESEIDSQYFLHSDQVQKYVAYESTFEQEWKNRLNLAELGDGKKPECLFDLWRSLSGILHAVDQLREISQINFHFNGMTFDKWKSSLEALLKELQPIHSSLNKEQKTFKFLRVIEATKVQVLDQCMKELDELRNPLFGFLFAGKKIKALEQRLSEEFFGSEKFSLKVERMTLQNELQYYKQSYKLEQKWIKESLDLFRTIREDKLSNLMELLEKIIGQIREVEKTKKELVKTVLALGVDSDQLDNELLWSFAKTSEEEILSVVSYLQTHYFINEGKESPANLYVEQRGILENRLILKMTNILDDSVVQFRENYRNDAEELHKIFRAKKKIPKHLLEPLVQAFPCLIVGIRELGEFIPLEANLFDVVIIDEASQVSIAQAFPAIIRGKKTVVLGDTKQFANVKSHNASIRVNNVLFNRVRDAFKKDIVNRPESERESLEMKIENFNIKNSILDFMKNIPNYECSLKKHFRGYIELISYSNKNFYQDSLQVMKIRGVSLNDVLQFHVIHADPRKERLKNTNADEINYILDELNRLKQMNYQGTVGIITPFTNQQKLLTSRILASKDWEYYMEKFHLKIMTFDSCQGEERDIIYYSMVEKPGEDSLKYIFPVKLDKAAEEENGTLKAQRLNVGFSRAKESIRFILSKQPEEIQHETGRVLQYFKNMLQGPDEARLLEQTDGRSKMEPMVLQWIQQTKFYKQNKEHIEIIPQFDIGRYIKQLDPMAKIPAYRIDFLLIFWKPGDRARSAIIEYDGFEFHFKSSDSINEFTYTRYYVESDVERQKTIESYGYPFIRLNKFVIRDNPLQYMDRQFARTFKITETEEDDDLRKEVAETYDKIESKQIKKCGKCGQMKDLSEFYDPNLATLYGRNCKTCKGKDTVRSR
ncbi:AAA domain-containing protein [Paenibacillus sp. 32352]|uniref:AAA domain-containing protein n=1 Tax=Paenibacillus sp. 32352 TaxID=1969111 RepID=UPI0015C4BF84|nr:AAA domain-containing protein [Paenibacillus sp. 32352]